MSFVLAGVAVVSAGVGIAKMIKGSSEKRKAKKANEQAKKDMEASLEKYKQMDTSNPYLNMENTMEDLTVNTQAADFAAEQNQIGMADTLSNMNQAAGGSGVAALAQAMANQSQIANQKAERKEAGNIQKLEREGEIQSRNLKQKIAGMELKLASGDVAGTAADIDKAQGQIDAGLSTVGSAAGTYAGGIG